MATAAHAARARAGLRLALTSPPEGLLRDFRRVTAGSPISTLHPTPGGRDEGDGNVVAESLTGNHGGPRWEADERQLPFGNGDSPGRADVDPAGDAKPDPRTHGDRDGQGLLPRAIAV